MRRALAVATWRLRRVVGRRWSSYLAIILLIGLLGGLAMASVAGARRTQASFPTYLASTNPSDASVFTEFGPVTHVGYSASVMSRISKLPYVRREVTTIGFDGTLQPAQRLPPPKVPGEAPPAFEGSLNGEYSSVDRVTLVSGRLANPRRPDELEMSAAGASNFGLRLGSTLRLSFNTLANALLPAYKGRPYRTVTFRVVGFVESSFQVVQSDDAALGSQFGIFTPALTRELARCCAYYSYASLQLSGGTRHLEAVQSELKRVLPSLAGAGGVQTNGGYIGEAERTIRPEAIAYGVFGLFAALAALLVSLQLIGRTTRRAAGDGRILRALGAERSVTVLDLCLGVICSIVCGSLLSVGIAIGLSPLAPIGPVRPLYPDPGIAIDWPVLGLGAVLLVVILSSIAIVTALRAAPHHQDGRGVRGSARTSSAARAAASAGLGPAAVTGIRYALDPGSRDDPAPVRSAALGAVLAVIVLTASVTFGASLNSLVSRPSLYGWNWNYALLSGFSGAEELDGPRLAFLLDHDRYVAHWSGVYFADASIDGRPVPVLTEQPRAAVFPTLLAGHPLQAASEIVLAPSTMAQLHKKIGDTVQAATGGTRSSTLRIVGSATMPTIGGSGSPALRMGTGAVIATSLFPARILNTQGSLALGPNAALIVIKPGVSAQVALGSLRQIERELSSSPDGPPSGVVPVLRPAEIADYRTVGSTPTLLAGVLAVGALAALGLTLAASVRRRRREIAMLKTLGFTRRQLAVSVAWQATVPAAIGIVLGVPLGIVLGRWVWTQFARGIFVVPYPITPVSSVLVIAVRCRHICQPCRSDTGTDSGKNHDLRCPQVGVIGRFCVALNQLESSPRVSPFVGVTTGCTARVDSANPKKLLCYRRATWGAGGSHEHVRHAGEAHRRGRRHRTISSPVHGCACSRSGRRRAPLLEGRCCRRRTRLSERQLEVQRGVRRPEDRHEALRQVRNQVQEQGSLHWRAL